MGVFHGSSEVLRVHHRAMLEVEIDDSLTHVYMMGVKLYSR